MTLDDFRDDHWEALKSDYCALHEDDIPSITFNEFIFMQWEDWKEFNAQKWEEVAVDGSC